MGGEIQVSTHQHPQPTPQHDSTSNISLCDDFIARVSWYICHEHFETKLDQSLNGLVLGLLKVMGFSQRPSRRNVIFFSGGEEETKSDLQMHCCGGLFPFSPPSSLLLSPHLQSKTKSSIQNLRANPLKTQIPINPSSPAKIRVSLPSHINSITSTTNPFLKHCLKLRQSSTYRHTHGSVLIIGTIPIREICMFQEIECLFLREEKIPKGLESLRSVRIVRVSSLVMKKLSGVQSSDSVEAIALMSIPNSYIDLNDDDDDDDEENDCKKWFGSSVNRVLVLDSIQDPGNLGTLIRSAMAFNWDGAFLLPGCCDPFNDKALRASRGASFQLPIVSGDWNHLKLLEDEFKMKLLAAHPSTKPEPVSKLSIGFARFLTEKPLCLILGSEGQGLSEKSRKICELVSIPMAGEFESLNVSVAGGIFLFMLQS